MLDPHISNELGRGTLDRESNLLAGGVTYARRFTYQDGHGQTVTSIITSRRPIVDVYRNVILRKSTVARRRAMPV